MSCLLKFGLPEPRQVNQNSCGLDVQFLIFNFSRVQDMDNVEFAHVPDVEAVEGFDDLMLRAVDGMSRIVK